MGTDRSTLTRLEKTYGCSYDRAKEGTDRGVLADRAKTGLDLQIPAAEKDSICLVMDPSHMVPGPAVPDPGIQHRDYWGTHGGPLASVVLAEKAKCRYTELVRDSKALESLLVEAVEKMP